MAAAAEHSYPVVPPSTDFSRYEKKVPWQPSRQLINSLTARRPHINFDEAKVPPYVLPEIPVLSNGPERNSTEVWEQQRRGELLAIFRREIYGAAPPRPDTLTFQVVESNPHAIDNQATLRRVAISFQLQAESFRFHLTLFVPNQSTRPVPVFLLLNHRPPENTDPTRRVKSEFWPVEYVIKRGYAIAAIDVANEVEPDEPATTTGVRQFYRKHAARPDEFTWGALSAWAWAGLRAVDYLEGVPEIDRRGIAMIGHSRGGKTCLWAAAQDSRIALVCVNNSGNTGAALARHKVGADIAQVNLDFPHWCTARYRAYNHREDLLPVDQHQLVALVAPRALHDGEAAVDLWGNPRGSWLALVAASKTWAMYGRAKPMQDAMPLVNELQCNGALTFHIREGGHGLRMYDWKLYLDHADALFPRPR